jgi:outer membrane protein assembly factor BamD (BamD/ComL family)
MSFIKAGVVVEWGMRLLKLLFLTGFMVLVFSCVTNAGNIPLDLSPQELIQKAQEASDRNNYQSAEVYYTEVLNRYPFEDDAVCEATYEIAFIHYKQRKWEIARGEFLALLDRYKEDNAEFLPTKYRILSENGLEKIKEKEASAKFGKF